MALHRPNLTPHKVSITDKWSSDIDRVIMDQSWLDLWDDCLFDQPDGWGEWERCVHISLTVRQLDAVEAAGKRRVRRLL